jgi:hypothetical protein
MARRRTPAEQAGLTKNAGWAVKGLEHTLDCLDTRDWYIEQLIAEGVLTQRDVAVLRKLSGRLWIRGLHEGERSAYRTRAGRITPA